jgi:Glycosyl hydrolase catalytic core
VPGTDATRFAFAGFAHAAVERYGPEGEFWSEGDPSCGLPFEIPVVCPNEEPPCGCDEPVPVTTWQVWNEPNSPKYAGPDASPAAYAELLQATSAAVRNADPDAEIVLGGIWGPRERPGDGGTTTLVPVGDFLDELYSFPGIEASFDAVAVHPYSHDVSGVLDQIAEARRAVEAAGDDAALYVTEIGWASSGPSNSRLVKGEKGQARMLSRTFSALDEQRRAFQLRGVFWYTWRDGTDAGICDWCAGAGLRTASGAPKPAWYEMTRFTGGSE